MESTQKWTENTHTSTRHREPKDTDIQKHTVKQKTHKSGLKHTHKSTRHRKERYMYTETYSEMENTKSGLKHTHTHKY